MNRALPSSLPPEDDLDRLLGDFFRSELPSPWPVLQPSLSRTTPPLPAPRAVHLAAAPTVSPRRAGRASSVPGRLALAAAALFLLAGAWALGGLAPMEGGALPALRNGGTASPPELPIPWPDSSREAPVGGAVKGLISLEQDVDGRRGSLPER